MTEKEKMPAGMPYDCSGSRLPKRWHPAKGPARQYSLTPSADPAAKDEILSRLLGSRGKICG